MRHVYVVTHAQAQHHLDGVVGGWHDSDLSPVGRIQADTISRVIAQRIPDGSESSVHTSDLRRSVQTAAPIAEALGVRTEPDPGLREISYGEAEGRPQAWLDERFVPATLTAAGRLDHDFGIPGAETKRQFGERVLAATNDILATECPHQVIVTHGYALTFVISAWLRLPLEEPRRPHSRRGRGDRVPKTLLVDGLRRHRSVAAGVGGDGGDPAPDQLGGQPCALEGRAFRRGSAPGGLRAVRGRQLVPPWLGRSTIR